MAARLQPDVVLMDLGMPVVNGVEATRQILAASPHIAVLVISMQEDSDSVFAALQAGARGYLLKGAMRAEILRSIKAVVHGEAIFGPAIAPPPDAVLRRTPHQRTGVVPRADRAGARDPGPGRAP